MIPSSKIKKIASAGSVARVNKKLTGTDLLMRHHNYGLGRTLAKKVWQKHSPAGDLSDCHWLITRVSPRKMKPSQTPLISHENDIELKSLLNRLQTPSSKGNFNNSMKAWGILTWKGKLYHNGEERRIKGVNSSGWKMIEDKLVFEQQKHSTLNPDLHDAWLLENAAQGTASKAAL